MGCWGKTKLFDLIRTGELESFLDGTQRRITVASIRARIQRKLQEAANETAQTGGRLRRNCLDQPSAAARSRATKGERTCCRYRARL